MIYKDEWLIHSLMWPFFEYAWHPKKEGVAFELL